VIISPVKFDLPDKLSGGVFDKGLNLSVIVFFVLTGMPVYLLIVCKFYSVAESSFCLIKWIL
jgi:hypothetical protein